MLDPFRMFLTETAGGPGGDGGNGGEGGEEGPGGKKPPPQEGIASMSQEDVEALRREATDARKEAAKYRTERNAATKRVEELEGASKSQLEKEQEARQKAEQSAQEATEKARLANGRLLAGNVGIDPKARADAVRLLDWSQIQDPDNDEQVEDALRELVKDRPYLLGRTPGGADGGAGGGTGGEVVDMDAAIRRAAGRQA